MQQTCSACGSISYVCQLHCSRVSQSRFYFEKLPFLIEWPNICHEHKIHDRIHKFPWHLSQIQWDLRSLSSSKLTSLQKLTILVHLLVVHVHQMWRELLLPDVFLVQVWNNNNNRLITWSQMSSFDDETDDNNKNMQNVDCPNSFYLRQTLIKQTKANSIRSDSVC